MLDQCFESFLAAFHTIHSIQDLLVQSTSFMCLKYKKNNSNVGEACTDASKRITMDTLARRVRFAREQKGIRQEDLAKLAGVTQQTIQQIEAGVIMRPKKIGSIAKALGRSPAWLQFGTEEIELLDKEAITLAQAWMSLEKTEKEAMFSAITQMAKSKKPRK
jgi:transcriptional regulator with XRE-family HTH domain